MTPPSLRARGHRPPFRAPYTDYVCTKCETIVLVPEKGCQHCAAQRARTRKEKPDESCES